MEPKNRLAEILEDLGLQSIRLSDALLDEWGMTPHRFNKLVQNNAVQPMTLKEAESLKKWLRMNFKDKNMYLFEHDMPAEMKPRQLRMNV